MEVKNILKILRKRFDYIRRSYVQSKLAEDGHSLTAKL